LIIEIAKIQHYHSIIVDGKIIIRDSSNDLVNDLGIIFEGKEINGGISIRNVVFNDYDDEAYEKYLDKHA